MKLKKHLLLLPFILFFLSACGADNYSSAFDRRVASESGAVNSSDNNSDHEDTSIENEDSVETQDLLFDKILRNSNVPEEALINAFEFYDNNRDIIKNDLWITIFDIKQHSGNKRFYVINMETGEVVATQVAHGKNSDTNHDGYATSFSNKNGSLQSSLGFMLAAETYSGKYNYSLRLDGLEDRNDNVRARAVVIHGANYVKSSLSKMGRSYGCPALSFDIKDWIIDRIRNGSLFYTYHEDYE